MHEVAQSNVSAPIESPPERRKIDVQLWLAIIFSALVLLPRSYMITRASSEHADDEYHIYRGLLFLEDRSRLGGVRINDPPLGEALGIAPLWLIGTWGSTLVRVKSFLWGQKFSSDTILNLIGLWKSLLFLPLIGVAFAWVRGLYGLKSAWLAVAVLLVEPTIAAHTTLAAIDVLGMEAIVIASFLAWRYFQNPTWGRLVAADVATAAALLIKHTAVIMPAVGLFFAGMWWIIKPWREGKLIETWKNQGSKFLLAAVAGVAITSFSVWVLLKFDNSRPTLSPDNNQTFVKDHPVLGKILDNRLPGGLYLSSFIQAMRHAERGHQAFLLGHISRGGWWYYFPVVASYKVPIGIGVVLLLGLVSFLWLKPKWDEWGMIIPMILLTGMMMTSHINIGWRHFLPAYAFMILLASRAVAGNVRTALSMTVLLAVGLGWVDTLRYHPDYLSYISFPRHDGWRAVSDSNVDWGQGMKYVQRWLDRNRARKDVFLRSNFWFPNAESVRRRFGKRITVLSRPPRLPTQGILIISPVSLVGLYELPEGRADPYRALRPYEPVAVLGHTMLIYDLDRIRPKDKPFDWGPQPRVPRKKKPPAPATRPTTQRATTSQ
jgi:hypothetical protein